MIEQFGRAGFLLVFAVAFPLIPIVASVALGVFRIRPRNPDPVKLSVYECGMVPVGDALVRYNVRYYLFALLFVLFDVEPVFLYPFVVLEPAHAYEAMQLIRDDEMLDGKFLVQMRSVDRINVIEVVYHFSSLAQNHIFQVKVPADHERPVVPSIASLWVGATLQEREIYVM